LQGDLGRFAASWSPDGRYLLYVYGAGVVRRSDLWALPLFGDGKAFPVLDTPFVETQGRFSPDGQWIAYASNDSGRFEVYVTPFPGPGRKWQVSSGGGGWPRWRRDGEELYYIAADRTLTAVQLKAAAGGLDVSPGQALFTAPLRPHVRLDAYSYDVTPDGQRFLLNTAGEEVPVTALTLVLNWTTSLRR
jgi:eukaryotic-like serine/threonine-protein kinase